LWQKLRERQKYERALKIERYKRKKRNWQKKISYDCRKRVADTRLRIKGRFISKKDTEKIYKLVEGKPEEAFNERKNLNLDYIATKFNLGENDDEGTNASQSQKPNMSKKFLLTKIDEILTQNINPISQETIQQIYNESSQIKNLLEHNSKSIFKISKNKKKFTPSFKVDNQPQEGDLDYQNQQIAKSSNQESFEADVQKLIQ